MLTDVGGVRVGHWSDPVAATGCTVIIPPQGSVCGVDVRGGGPGTRETDLMGPLASVEEVTALLFTGGSAFGLGAASGVVDWCEEHGLGFPTGLADVPIVPAAVIYDLGIGDAGVRPGPQDAYAACEAATGEAHPRGNVGAGTGATVGKMLGLEGWCKGGLGTATCVLHDGTTVAALAVVNAFGDVLAGDGSVLAGAWAPGRGFIGSRRAAWAEPPRHPRLIAEATTLLAIVTDGRLDKVDATRVARMAQAGVCRAIAPVHTPLDGDVAFCIATGERPVSMFACGAAAAEAAVAAVRDAVTSATALHGVPTGADRRAAEGRREDLRPG